jgi:precorrin isomerase
MENSCRVTVGRLMEIRIHAGFLTEADIDAQIARVKHALATVPEGTSVVIAADWRRVAIMSERVAARAVNLLTTAGERIERSGILAIPDAPTAVMQFFRIVRESEHPRRKVVTSIIELEDWLLPVLTPAETKRLVEFLHE